MCDFFYFFLSFSDVIKYLLLVDVVFVLLSAESLFYQACHGHRLN